MRPFRATTKSVISETSHQTRPKAIPEKVKLDIRVFAFPLSILAIDDLGFRRMQLQVALHQSVVKLSLKGLCLLLCPTVHQPIICISTPREIRMCPRHPEVKRVVHKKVDQGPERDADGARTRPKQTKAGWRQNRISVLAQLHPGPATHRQYASRL